MGPQTLAVDTVKTWFVFFNYVFYFYFWLCWVVVSEWAFYIVSASRGYSLHAMQGLLIEAASLVVEHGLQGLQSSAAAEPWLNSCGSGAPEHRLSSCGTQA